MTEVLSSQHPIRQAIRDIFRDRRRRRIAIVAFVGDGALGYLGDPDGIEIVCWPKAGGTNPSVVRELMDCGARVFFADRLHMKLYWASGGDAVIGSANLTSNALGSGSLRELAVRVPASSVPINKLLKEIRRAKVTAKSLAKLKREHERYYRRHGGARSVGTASTFPEWYASRPRRKWHFSWAASYVNRFSRRAQQAARRAHGETVDAVYCQRGELSADTWVLAVMTDDTRLTYPRWCYVHTVVLVERRDRVYQEQWPFQAVQVFPLRQCPAPPFRIDQPFRAALRTLARELGSDTLQKRLLQDTTKPMPRDLLERLHSRYRRTVGANGRGDQRLPPRDT